MKDNYSLIYPLIIERYKECGNITQTAREFGLNKKTVRSWLIKHNIDIKPNNIDIMGQTFGRLNVVGCVGKDKHHKYIWRCKCDCGEEADIRANDLKQGKTKSCGCLHKETSAQNGKKSLGSVGDRTKFHGEMSGTYYSQTRHQGVKRGFVFLVTKDFLWNLFLKQDRKCSLSGVDLVMNKTASLDRIDSQKGYTEDNVQWVHKDVNRMKLAYNQDYFIDFCGKIYKNKILNLN